MPEAKNIIQLKAYYDSTEGHNFCRILRKIISNHWKKPAKENIIGYGFAMPYLPVFSGNENRMVSISPAHIGSMNIGNDITSVICNNESLPLKNENTDKIICIHALEGLQNVDELLAEFWRVLKPYGRLIIFTENEKLFPESIIPKLRANKFFLTFSRKCMVSDSLPMLELFSSFAGKYNVIEAQKLVFAPRGRTQRITKSIWEKLFKPKPTLEGAS